MHINLVIPLKTDKFAAEMIIRQKINKLLELAKQQPCCLSLKTQVHRKRIERIMLNLTLRLRKQTPFPCLFRQKPHWGNAVRIFYKQKGHCKRYDNTDMVND